jgi:uncharacterized protein
MGYFEREIRQIAALPLIMNEDGSVDVCIITARGSGRWIIPKGNPIRGLAPHEVAAREALEEAGLLGQAHPHRIGTFTFERRRDGREKTCTVDVYAMKVERQLKDWPEIHERSVLRCSAQTALSLIALPDLARLIKDYLQFRVSTTPTSLV